MPALKFQKDANCPVIELTIDGVKHNFLIDTGATATVLCHDLARKLRFHRTIHCSGFNTSGPSATFIGKFNVLGKTITEVMVCDIPCPGLQISGILGNDLFNKFTSMEVDFRLCIIRFKE